MNMSRDLGGGRHHLESPLPPPHLPQQPSMAVVENDESLGLDWLGSNDLTGSAASAAGGSDRHKRAVMHLGDAL